MAGQPKRRGERPPAGSGVREDGSFEPEFPGQREPFAPGNEVAVKHGGYAVVRLQPRASEIAGELRRLADLEGIFSPLFEPTYAAAALVAARCEAAFAAADLAEPGDRERLDREARSWARTLLTYMMQLGFTPLSRAKLGLDVALGQDAARRALTDHLAGKVEAE